MGPPSVNPSVIHKDNEYKMWYDVNYGDGWRTNYAHSLDGINNWKIPYQTIIPAGSSDKYEKEMANPNVLYNSSLNLYQMWYCAIGQNQDWTSGTDRWRLGYATSTDGISWTKNPNWALKGTLGSWDGGGIARGLSVIYKDNLYQMWYAATDEKGLNWKIGYATSTDGISWTKQNNGNPVILPTRSWELTTDSYPTVLYSNGIYNMWYGASSGDMPGQIVYAYSSDGINWIKPEEFNPVFTITPGSFDQNTQTISTVIKEDNQLKMWYSGFDGYLWQVGYATASADWLPTSSPTPIPTPQIPTKQVIVIPGMTASWN